MKRTRPSLLTVFLAALLFASSVAAFADEGVELAPLKPLHRVCGVVVAQDDERIPNVTVTVLEGEKEIAVQKTGADGKFAFDSLKPGKYELRMVWGRFH